jgi:DNA-binding MarR family transcriptional regulator
MVPPRGKTTPGQDGDPPADADTSVPAGRAVGAGGGDGGFANGGLGIAHLLRDTQRALSRILAARIADHGVSIGQWYFLRALWDEDGLTQRELSFRVGMMEPTTVTALNGMEQRGLVARVRNPHDRRKMNIYLTERGRALQKELLPIEAEINKIAIDGIAPGDAAALDRALRQILKN